MEQRELMRSEKDRPDRYTLALVMHLANPDDLVEECRIFLSIVYEWFEAREELGERVHLIAVSDPLYHVAIMEIFEVIHAGDLNVRHVFEKVPFLIDLRNQNGSQVSEKELLPTRKKAEKENLLARFFSKIGVA